MRTTLVALALLAFGVADAAAQLRTRVHASGFSQPIAIVQDPADAAVQLVVEQAGRIRVVQDGTVQAADFLDIRSVVRSGGEQGLLGLAFPPDAGLTGRFYVNFTNEAGHTVVARFRRSSNPLVADPSSRFDLRWNGAGAPALIEQPFSNHNGGHLAFGADGYLYVGMGDGGSGDDPNHFAQTPASLLGKMLRVDVNVADSHTIGYVVPADNPFTAAGTRREIWSFGWRNPWRYTFDDRSRGGTGAMVAGDVGQNQWEEINYEPAGRGGRNYGWRNREGAHDNVTSRPPAFLPLVDPVFEYPRSSGLLIEPGVVQSAVLFRPMLVYEPDERSDLSGSGVFISAGRMDPIVPVTSVERLVELFETAHAEVTLKWQLTGHSLVPSEVREAGDWFALQRARV